jgi:hypothetical protein
MAPRDINYAKPAMAEMSPLIVVKTGIVRPAVADGIRHTRERSFRTRSGPGGHKSSDPAHGFSVTANCPAVGALSRADQHRTNACYSLTDADFRK